MADKNFGSANDAAVACEIITGQGVRITNPKTGQQLPASDYAIAIGPNPGQCAATKMEADAKPSKSTLYPRDVPVSDPVSPSAEDRRPAQPYLNSRPVNEPAPRPR